MGYTFAAALLKKPNGKTAPGTRKAFREAMKNMGYRKAASAEEASLSLHMYQDKKSKWLSLALDVPDSLAEELEFPRKLSVEMHTPVLYFINFDSDFLYVAATDGKTVQHVHVGWIDEDGDEENAETMQDSEDLSIFDALLPDDTAQAEFPDAPIYRGVNPASPLANSMKAYHYHAGQKCSLTVAFRGGTFKVEPLKAVDPRMMMNPAAMVEYHQKIRDFYQKAGDGTTQVWIVPIDNPAGAITYSIPREPIQHAHYWPEDTDTSD